MSLRKRFRRTPLTAFLVRGIFWLVVLTGLWATVTPWAMRPAAQLAHVVLGNAFHGWVREVHHAGDVLEVETHIELRYPDAPGRVANPVAEVHPARYGFGLPLFLALLLAAGNGHLVRNACLGSLALVPFQAFGIVFDVLKQAAIAWGPAATMQTGLASWQINGIALCYQLGVLVLPALVPIMLWLWMDRRFVAAVVLEGWLERSLAKSQ